MGEPLHLSQSDIMALIELFKVAGVTTISIERSKVWNNDKQSRTDEDQYQVFTNKNGCCTPAPDVETAADYARKRITSGKANDDPRYEP